MELNNQDVRDDRNDHPENKHAVPVAQRIDDDNNLAEGDLTRTLFTGGDTKKPVLEGTGEGGQNFGKNNLTPAANDKNNPSQNAGNTNAYFDRTEPSEEHPEDSNFADENQDGSPDYSKAQPTASGNNGAAEPKKPDHETGNNDHPHPREPYREGTVDDDGEPNIPGPNELPDQQKVGEDADNDEREHIET